ncbi:hypothetical protein K461DRAFT_272179 [Myriangium duriaei CBS 260.36]|uniref:Uncharacterized protein n=1 Tax=Myriangium duriaei CBS 260.36 TaxID=1168546 RepID=A0A9P4MFJ3_9PEZI|nr:hypothetical protein K461DRAFT_272179 [Myriangium duriaei CBS 260.36]
MPDGRPSITNTEFPAGWHDRPPYSSLILAGGLNSPLSPSRVKSYPRIRLLHSIVGLPLSGLTGEAGQTQNQKSRAADVHQFLTFVPSVMASTLDQFERLIERICCPRGSQIQRIPKPNTVFVAFWERFNCIVTYKNKCRKLVKVLYIPTPLSHFDPKLHLDLSGLSLDCIRELHKFDHLTLILNVSKAVFPAGWHAPLGLEIIYFEDLLNMAIAHGHSHVELDEFSWKSGESDWESDYDSSSGESEIQSNRTDLNCGHGKQYVSRDAKEASPGLELTTFHSDNITELCSQWDRFSLFGTHEPRSALPPANFYVKRQNASLENGDSTWDFRFSAGSNAQRSAATQVFLKQAQLAFEPEGALGRKYEGPSKVLPPAPTPDEMMFEHPKWPQTLTHELRPMWQSKLESTPATFEEHPFAKFLAPDPTPKSGYWKVSQPESSLARSERTRSVSMVAKSDRHPFEAFLNPSSDPRNSDRMTGIPRSASQPPTTDVLLAGPEEDERNEDGRRSSFTSGDKVQFRPFSMGSQQVTTERGRSIRSNRPREMTYLEKLPGVGKRSEASPQPNGSASGVSNSVFRLSYNPWLNNTPTLANESSVQEERTSVRETQVRAGEPQVQPDRGPNRADRDSTEVDKAPDPTTEQSTQRESSESPTLPHEDGLEHASASGAAEVSEPSPSDDFNLSRLVSVVTTSPPEKRGKQLISELDDLYRYLGKNEKKTVTLQSTRTAAPSKLYEDICHESLQYVFGDKLGDWRRESRSGSGRERTDATAKIRSREGFYACLWYGYNTWFLTFEFKFHAGELLPQIIHDKLRYLSKRAKRSTLIFVSPKGLSAAAQEKTQAAFRNDFIVLHLTTDMLCQFLLAKDKNNESPCQAMGLLLDDFLYTRGD